MKQTAGWNKLTELNFMEIREWECFITNKNFIDSQEQWNDIVNSETCPIELWQLLNNTNIGKMIEYIDDYVDLTVQTSIEEDTSISPSLTIKVYLVRIDGENIRETISEEKRHYVRFKGHDLCNVLWNVLTYMFDNVVDWSED